MLLKQQYRIQWLIEGVRNTGFFHKNTLKNRCRNRIRSLLKGDDSIVTEGDEINTKVVNYVMNKWSSNNMINARNLITYIQKLVSIEDNQTLLEYFLKRN